MTPAVIVQARLSSTRLPGKVLLDLDGQSVLSHVLQRCRAIEGVDVVCCATVTGDDGDRIAAEAQRCGAQVYRGSEFDVLSRYAEAAAQVGADVVMRVTSDCPAIDPAVCAAVIGELDASCEYACNFLPVTWPHGLDCDAFSMRLLERANAQATADSDREHVTTLMRRMAGIAPRNVACPVQALTEQRWTLDTPRDLAFLRAVFPLLPRGRAGWSWQALVDVVRAQPELLALNAVDRAQRGAAAPAAG